MAEKEFKYLVRVANTDLDGNKQLAFAMQKIKGVSLMFANAVCQVSGVDPKAKTGYLESEDIAKLTTTLKDTSKIPTWLKNRQKDYETGVDKHLLTSDLEFTQDNDIKRLKMVKSYKGLRHQLKLTVRGQRTQSNFRRTKTANSRKKKQMKMKKGSQASQGGN